MNKKRGVGFIGSNKLIKICRIMRLCIFLVFVLVMNVSARTLAQRTVTVSAEQLTYKEIFLEIQKQTGFMVVYNNQRLDLNKKVPVHFNKASVPEVLNKVLENTGLTYTLMDDYVVLSKAQAQQPQSIVLTGKVTDKDKNPLPGVTVMVKEGNVTLGATTSVDGVYRFAVPVVLKDFSITFSFVGMETKVVKYEGQKTIDVVMREDYKEMDEVVVTGYQTLKKRSQAGSISTVKAEDLVLNGTQSLEQALQGKVPGMIVMNRSGLTGTRQRIRVRGTSTLLGNAEPVWVVDGIIQDDPLPFSSNDFQNMNMDDTDMIHEFVGSAISWLNPNDIESVTVLKDASSTAIYGVRAANGVIVINTKKGQIGRMSVSYNGNFSLTPRLNYDRMELMNSQQRVAVSREAYEKNMVLGSNPEIGYGALANAYRNREIDLETFTREAKRLEKFNTDWFDLLFRNAFSHNHTIGVSGGTDKVTYRFSIGYNTINNTARGNDQNVYTMNMNVTTNLRKNLSVTAQLAGSITKTKAFADGNPFQYASQTNRAIGCFDENGERMFYRYNNGKQFNILNELEQTGNENQKNTLNSTLSLRWNFLDGWTYTTNFGYNTSNTDGFTYYSEQTNRIAVMRGYNYEEYGVGSDPYNSSKLPYGGEYNNSQNSNMNLTWRNQLEFRKVFKELHALTFMAGQEIRTNKTEGGKYQAYGYMPDKGKLFVELPITTGLNTFNTLLQKRPSLTESLQHNLSFYANVDYMFDNRYSINASIRSDASNQFGQSKSTRFLPVWSVGARWNVGSEHWLKDQNILSDMSIRASYGFQGNTANVSPYLIANLTTSKEQGFVLKIKDLPAPELKWEKVGSFNVGIDFSLFSNHIRGSFEYYHKQTRDMVVDQVIPYANGTPNRPVNGGKMKNRGWDANISFNAVRSKDWLVTLNFNFGKVYNEVKSTLVPVGSWSEATSGNLNKEGYPVSSFWAFRFTGLNPETGGPQFDLTGAELDAAKKDATLYMDYVGKKEPDFTTNFSLSVRYKSFSLNSSFHLSLGNKGFMAPLSTNYTSIPNEYENMSTEWLKRWQKPGDEKFTNTPALPDISTSARIIQVAGSTLGSGGDGRFQPYELYANSTARVVDLWFLKCQNLSLSYTLPAKALPQVIKNLSFNATVSNLFQLRSKDFKGRDPEVMLGSQPLSSTYTLGVTMNF